MQLALQSGNAGIDIDYPNVAPARKADFTGFITVLAGQLHQANRTLSVTLPTPKRAGVSWDTGAYDWEQITQQADLVKLRPNPDPSLYFQSVTDVLDYLKGRNVDLKKVALVVNRESYESGPDGLTGMNLFQALSLASDLEVRTASTITPNSSVVIVGAQHLPGRRRQRHRVGRSGEGCLVPVPGLGGTHTVWMENSLSLAFKLQLASKYGLVGVAISDVSEPRAKADFWEPLRATAGRARSSPRRPTPSCFGRVEVQAGDPQPESKGNLVWTAPAQPGTYQIDLIVSDGVIRASRSLQLEVQAPAPTNN